MRPICVYARRDTGHEPLGELAAFNKRKHRYRYSSGL